MFTMKNSGKALSVTLLTLFVAGTAVSAMAADHPRREQVNERLHNQNKRINKERKEGEISQKQANKLHREDRQIRKEENAMAAQHGGHITKQEQRKLNRQENVVSKQIGK